MSGRAAAAAAANASTLSSRQHRASASQPEAGSGRRRATRMTALPARPQKGGRPGPRAAAEAGAGSGPIGRLAGAVDTAMPPYRRPLPMAQHTGESDSPLAACGSSFHMEAAGRHHGHWKDATQVLTRRATGITPPKATMCLAAAGMSVQNCREYPGYEGHIVIRLCLSC